MIKRIFLTSFLAGVMLSANAQDWKRTQNWYFGDKAGLSFATDPPTVLTDGAMSTIEGCATISDTDGNLLFYTNGVTVWNKNHQIMENGTGLNGHVSSTQSSLIIPWPENDSLYYIFTTDAVGQWKGLQYSLVNVYANNGLGKVIMKNCLLITPVCERLASVIHANNKDIWIIAQKWNSNLFYAYLITSESLLVCPVISSTGTISAGSVANAQGSMKISPSGRILGACVFQTSNSKVELFNFNKMNGSINLYYSIIGNLLDPYSIEFSPDEEKLYVSSNNTALYQFDLTSSNINNSQFELFKNKSRNDVTATLQIALNKKIYLTYPDSSSIGVINLPNNEKENCSFQIKGINIQDKVAQYGLPNFVSSYFYRPSLDFKYKTTCDDHTVYFEGQFSDSNATPRWSIFQGSNLIYTSQLKAYSYQFTDTGEYLVRLVASGDTVDKNISIEPNLLAYADTIVCNASEIELNIPSNFRCINWQDGSGASRYTINQSGTYYVSAYNQKGCLVSDTIQVKFGGVPKPNIRRSGDSLHTDSAAHLYIWHLNNAPIANTKASIRVTEQGTYRVETRDTLGCAAVSEPLQVEVLSIHSKEKPTFNIYPNPSLLGSEIHIESESLIHSIKITDLTGRTVYQKKDLNQNQLTLKLSKRGVYIFTINGSNHFRMLIE